MVRSSGLVVIMLFFQEHRLSGINTSISSDNRTRSSACSSSNTHGSSDTRSNYTHAEAREHAARRANIPGTGPRKKQIARGEEIVRGK